MQKGFTQILLWSIASYCNLPFPIFTIIVIKLKPLYLSVFNLCARKYAFDLFFLNHFYEI